MSLLRDVMAQVRDRLMSHAAFQDVEILVADEGNIENEISRVVNKLGAFAVIVIEEVRAAADDTPGPVFDSIALRIEIGENRTLSAETDPVAAGLAETACGLLHQWTPENLSTCLRPGNPVMSMESADGVVIWTVRFVAYGAVAVALDAVATVSASRAAGQITLTCATAGAAIYYTTNGRHPSPRVGTLYTGPFADPATTVKAKAWLAGYDSSPLTTLAP